MAGSAAGRRSMAREGRESWSGCACNRVHCYILYQYKLFIYSVFFYKIVNLLAISGFLRFWINFNFNFYYYAFLC